MNANQGSQSLGTSGSEFNAASFHIWSILSRVRTALPVQVVAVSNAGGVSPVGTVSLMPMVNQMDGGQKTFPHKAIFNCPYVRIQGGANAIILDPQVGDIGVAVFADRDISSVVANKAISNPGSQRKFSMADAMYMGGMLNGLPSQYVQFSTTGINITSPTAIVLDAPTVTINAPTVTINASTGLAVNTPLATFSGDVLDNSGSNSRTLAGMRSIYNSHTHGGVQSGGSNTSGPSATE